MGPQQRKINFTAAACLWDRASGWFLVEWLFVTTLNKRKMVFVLFFFQSCRDKSLIQQ